MREVNDSEDIFGYIKSKRLGHNVTLWWEIRRIPYNVIMYFVGLSSFYIGYVTIPMLYVIIGLALNIGYTICWAIELELVKNFSEVKKIKYSRIIFYSYLMFSIMIVIGFAAFLFL